MMITGDEKNIKELCTLLGGELENNTCIVRDNFKIGAVLDNVNPGIRNIEIVRRPFNIIYEGKNKPVVVYYSDKLPVEEHCKFKRYMFTIVEEGNYMLIIVPRRVLE